MNKTLFLSLIVFLAMGCGTIRNSGTTSFPDDDNKQEIKIKKKTQSQIDVENRERLRQQELEKEKLRQQRIALEKEKEKLKQQKIALENEKKKLKQQDKIIVKKEKVSVIGQKDNFANYYVIIGSFRVLDNVHKYRKKLAKEGFESTILRNETGLYRVSVGAFNNENNARNRVNNIRKNYPQYYDSWLLIRKK